MWHKRYGKMGENKKKKLQRLHRLNGEIKVRLYKTDNPQDMSTEPDFNIRGKFIIAWKVHTILANTRS